MEIENYKVYIDYSGTPKNINTLSKKSVGPAILTTYKRIKVQFRTLVNLHARLFVIRSKSDENAKLTDSKKKVVKLLRLPDIPTEEELRLRVILQNVAKFTEMDADKQVILNLIKQGLKEDD